MKIETKEQIKVSPVIITLETQEEIDQLYAIINYVSIGENVLKMDDNDWGKIHEELEARVSSGYIQWHKMLKGVNKQQER